ncbi:hypothetical protein MRX96_035945 [Rhipicephalus microplus]
MYATQTAPTSSPARAQAADRTEPNDRWKLAGCSSETTNGRIPRSDLPCLARGSPLNTSAACVRASGSGGASNSERVKPLERAPAARSLPDSSGVAAVVSSEENRGPSQCVRARGSLRLLALDFAAPRRPSRTPVLSLSRRRVVLTSLDLSDRRRITDETPL